MPITLFVSAMDDYIHNYMAEYWVAVIANLFLDTTKLVSTFLTTVHFENYITARGAESIISSNFVFNPSYGLSGIFNCGLRHGHLYTGQLSPHFVFWQVDIMRGNTWDQTYAQGLDFLDHNFFILKNSGQDLSNQGSNFILSSLEVGHSVAQT